MKKILLLAVSALLMVSCAISRPKITQQSHTISLGLVKEPQANIYINMDYGIRLNVLDKRADMSILNKYDGTTNSVRPNINTYPDIRSFVSESIKKYMQTMGFVMDADVNTDYMLHIEITQFQVSYLSGTGWIATICLDMMIYDANRAQVYPRTTVTGRHAINNPQLATTTDVINTAYTNALENIDWDRVAYFLRRSKSAAEEKNKQVTGEGNTALEHTVIRWYIDSSPRGADVLWRVVSSTSDVKNTNQVYLGTTPYESTETFDIKGLTFNNSGDIQIEISCEKVGYLTQKRRFNLRQVIEQKEISTKLNLIKEE